MTTPDPKAAHATYKKLHALYINQRSLAAKLFSHPGATDEQILEAAKALGATRRTLAQTRKAIRKHAASNPTSFAWQRLNWFVNSKHL